MKRIYTLLLLTSLVLTASATVKPRYRGATTAVWATTDEAETTHTPTLRRVGLHSNAPLQSFGSPCVPVILVQFSDLKFTSGLADGETCESTEQFEAVNEFFDLFCNGQADGTEYTTLCGSMGSITEYFRDQSDGQFTPKFKVIGPVTLSNSHDYYGKNSGSSKDVNINAFYKESIQKAQELESDWAQFDNDGNGKADMAFFIFAGEGENSGAGAECIWPKEQPNGGTIGGVEYGCYACCNETYKGKPDGIGVFVHELSHALGLPDLYDYNYVAYGLDYWDIMDSGCYNQDGKTPCGYSAYEKDFMGWQNLVTLDPTVPQHLVLQPGHQWGEAYKIVNPNNANEYYIIENRQSQLWDTYIGKGTERTKMHGLLITHIDYAQSSWTSNRLNSTRTRQRCSIIPADGDLFSYMNVRTGTNISVTELYNEFYLSVTCDAFPGRTGITEWNATDSINMPYWATVNVNDTIVEEVNGLETTRIVTRQVDSLLVQKLPPFYTKPKFYQPLINIQEMEDGTVELDYCPNGQFPTAIYALPTRQPKDATLYSINGVSLGTVRLQGQHPDLSGLPAGIYIVNKQKYIVK